MNAASGVLAARLLGPVGEGQLTAILLWATFLGTLAMLGLPEALVYFSARSRDEAGRYLGSAMSLGLVSSFAFMAIGYLLMPLLLSAQSPSTVGLARLYLWIGPLYALSGMPLHALRGEGEFIRWNLLRILPSLLWILVLTLALLVGRANPGFLAWANLFAMCLAVAVVAATARTRVVGPYRATPRLWPPMLRFGLPSVLSTIPQTLNLRLDQMLMTAVVPARQLGLYIVAVAWSSAVYPVVSALGLVLFPRIAGEADRDGQRAVLGRGARLSALVAVGVTAVVFAATPVAVTALFGRGFRDAVPAALVLVVAGGVLSYSFVLQESLRGLGLPSAALWSELGGLVATAVFLAALLGPLGIIGAAIASMAGYSTTAALLVLQAHRATKLPWSALLRPGRSEAIEVSRAIGKLASRVHRRSSTDG